MSTNTINQFVLIGFLHFMCVLIASSPEVQWWSHLHGYQVQKAPQEYSTTSRKTIRRLVGEKYFHKVDKEVMCSQLQMRVDPGGYKVLGKLSV